MVTVSCILAALLMMHTVIAIAEPIEAPSPDRASLIGNWIDRTQYMHYGPDGLLHAEACAEMGALKLPDMTGNEVLLDLDTDLISRKPHVDMSISGIIPLQIYLIKNDQKWLDLGLTFADRQLANLREEGLTQKPSM